MTHEAIPGIAANLETVRAKIGKAQNAAVAPAKNIALIAVSKTHDAASVEEALVAGQRDFGENRVQEAKGKFPLLREKFPDLRLHLIGPLQSNKAREAVSLFDTIHSLDRESLAEALHDELERTPKYIEIFIQVNIGEEAQKSGVAPRDTENFVRFARSLALPVTGLMCIPPADENPAPYFALLKKIGADTGLENLSMGMSSDYETAIRFGATHVRVGTAIFGERPALISAQ